MRRKPPENIGYSEDTVLDLVGLGATPRETSYLRALVHGAIQARSYDGLHSGQPPGGAMVLPRPSFKRPLNVLVAPVCAQGSLFPQAGAAAAVVAGLLLAGRYLPAIAEELLITLNTAKTRAKRAFMKRREPEARLTSFVSRCAARQG